MSGLVKNGDNPCESGLVVHGDDVTMCGLACLRRSHRLLARTCTHAYAGGTHALTPHPLRAATLCMHAHACTCVVARMRSRRILSAQPPFACTHMHARVWWHACSHAASSPELRRRYGLAVEHTLGDLTRWHGERGATYFYQSEMPYDATQVS